MPDVICHTEVQEFILIPLCFQRPKVLMLIYENDPISLVFFFFSVNKLALKTFYLVSFLIAFSQNSCGVSWIAPRLGAL